MGSVLIIVLIIAILTITSFSILTKRKKPDEYWNWWISFISTIVSVILGIGVGIYLFEYSQDRIKNDEKERITFALETELSEIYTVLDTGEKFNIKDKNNKEIKALLINLDQIVVNDAIRSNLFDKDATTQLIYISRNIKMVDKSVDNLWAFLRVCGFYNSEYRDEIIRTSVTNIEKYQNNIKICIRNLERLLNRNFTKIKHNPPLQPTAYGRG